MRLHNDDIYASSIVIGLAVVLFTVSTSCFIVVYTDTADSLLITATVLVMERFGWTTFVAVERKQISQIVNITTGDVTTVDTVMMSLSLVLQVSQFTLYSSWK